MQRTGFWYFELMGLNKTQKADDELPLIRFWRMLKINWEPTTMKKNRIFERKELKKSNRTTSKKVRKSIPKSK